MNSRTRIASLTALVFAASLAMSLAAFASDDASLQKTAQQLYSSLSEDQKKQATLPYDAPERTKEVFTGGVRAGVHIKDLNPDQQALAMALLTGFTSDYGKKKAIEIADQPSNTNDPTTGFGRYYLCFFGEPGEGKTYAWRIAEHHLTIVHMEIEKGEPSSFGPILLGANPATLFDEEEDKLLALYAAMTQDEQAKSKQSGKGISSEMLKGEAGIRVGDLNPSAKKAAEKMFDQRLSFYAEPITARVKKIVESNGGLDDMRIVYYGDVNGKKCRDGGRWDFKLAGKSFLCDYEGSRAHIHLAMKGQLAQSK
jgi:hypothetical protein